MTVYSAHDTHPSFKPEGLDCSENFWELASLSRFWGAFAIDGDGENTNWFFFFLVRVVLIEWEIWRAAQTFQ